jgi:hypothetical protein
MILRRGFSFLNPFMIAFGKNFTFRPTLLVTALTLELVSNMVFAEGDIFCAPHSRRNKSHKWLSE